MSGSASPEFDFLCPVFLVADAIHRIQLPFARHALERLLASVLELSSLPWTTSVGTRMGGSTCRTSISLFTAGVPA